MKIKKEDVDQFIEALVEEATKQEVKVRDLKETLSITVSNRGVIRMFSLTPITSPDGSTSVDYVETGTTDEIEDTLDNDLLYYFTEAIRDMIHSTMIN